MAVRLVQAPLACDVDESLRGAVGVIGNLDGVHLGHQALVRFAKEVAGDRPVAAVTFDPHPGRVFKPDSAPFELTDLEQKTDFLGHAGADMVFVLPFNDLLYTQDPQTFVHTTLGQRLGLKAIVTGADFHFGAKRAGNVEILASLAADAGMSAHAVTPVLREGDQKYSSTDIRQDIAEGRLDDAAAALGRPFTIAGTVVEGQKLARTLNFPTANVPMAGYIRPPFGVYAVMVETVEGQLPGVANIGRRPTVEGTDERLEAHLFDVSPDLYGTRIEVELHHFLRPEQKFDGLEALKAQIARDVESARTALDNVL